MVYCERQRRAVFPPQTSRPTRLPLPPPPSLSFLCTFQSVLFPPSRLLPSTFFRIFFFRLNRTPFARQFHQFHGPVAEWSRRNAVTKLIPTPRTVLRDFASGFATSERSSAPAHLAIFRSEERDSEKTEIGCYDVFCFVGTED